MRKTATISRSSLCASSLAIAACIGAFACTGDEGARVDGDDDVRGEGVGVVTGAADGGATTAFEVSVQLSSYGCSAAFSCRDDFLFDPATAVRAPSVMTSFSCGFEDGAPPYDALLAFHGVINCYRNGPAREMAEDPIAVTLPPSEQLFFSSRVGDGGDAYTNWGGLIKGLYKQVLDAGGSTSNPFCHLDGYGFYTYEPAGTGRHALVLSRPAVVRWSGYVSLLGENYDCHSEPGDLSRVDRTVVHTLIRDLPDREEGVFPTTYSWALLEEKPVVALVGEGEDPVAMPHEGVEIVVGAEASFPEESTATMAPFLRRDLWIATPGVSPTRPADVRAGRVCVNFADNAIDSVAVELTDPNHIPLGAVLVPAVQEADPDVIYFDCVRDDEGACRLIDPLDYATQAGCLDRPLSIARVDGPQDDRLEPLTTQPLSVTAHDPYEDQGMTYAWSFVGFSGDWALTNADTRTPSLRAPDKNGLEEVTLRVVVTSGGQSAEETLTVRLFAERSCLGYDTAARDRGTGIYWINPVGGPVRESIQAYCDMETLGGGWTLISNRKANSVNREDCGESVSDFFTNGCGTPGRINHNQSYAIPLAQRRPMPKTELMLEQTRVQIAGLIITPDPDDAYVISLGPSADEELFPTFVVPQPRGGSLRDFPVDRICLRSNPSTCDDRDVFWRYIGDTWYASSLCLSGQDNRLDYHGNYGVCHNRVAYGGDPAPNYYSSGFAGDRSGYNETKLWGHVNGAAEYQERIWYR